MPASLFEMDNLSVSFRVYGLWCYSAFDWIFFVQRELCLRFFIVSYRARARVVVKYFRFINNTFLASIFREIRHVLYSRFQTYVVYQMSTSKDDENSTFGKVYINKELVIPRGDDDKTLDAIVTKRKLIEEKMKHKYNSIIHESSRGESWGQFFGKTPDTTRFQFEITIITFLKTFTCDNFWVNWITIPSMSTHPIENLWSKRFGFWGQNPSRLVNVDF